MFFVGDRLLPVDWCFFRSRSFCFVEFIYGVSVEICCFLAGSLFYFWFSDFGRFFLVFLLIILLFYDSHCFSFSFLFLFLVHHFYFFLLSLLFDGIVDFFFWFLSLIIPILLLYPLNLLCQNLSQLVLFWMLLQQKAPLLFQP